MTLARLLDAPKGPRADAQLRAAVDAMTHDLCGLQTSLTEAWYIEEQDKLALALNGKWVKHDAPFNEARCA